MCCMSQNFCFFSRIEFIRSELLIFSAHVSGVTVGHQRTGRRRQPVPTSDGLQMHPEKVEWSESTTDVTIA